MTSTDLFGRRANECRRLAAAARDAADRAFWLELAERWQAARQRRLRQILIGGLKKKLSPGRGGKAAGAKSSPAERGGHPRRLAG
jgi:hypothetical protein